MNSKPCPFRLASNAKKALTVDEAMLARLKGKRDASEGAQAVNADSSLLPVYRTSRELRSNCSRSMTATVLLSLNSRWRGLAPVPRTLISEPGHENG